MGVFLLFFILLAFSIALSIIIKKEISETIFLSLIGTLALLYILGILNLLHCSLVIIIGLSIIAIVFDLYYLIKHPDFIKTYLLKPALLFYFLVFAFALIFFHNSFLKSWDEFTHWALYAKNIYMYDRLTGVEFTSTNNGYPPIATLLQYIIAKLENGFTEANLYRSNFLFCSISLIPVLKNTSFKKPVQMLIMFFIIVCAPLLLFTNYYGTIQVDILLAMLSTSIIMKLYMEEVSLFNWMYMFLISSVLVLVKEFGLILTGIFYIVLVIDILFIRRKKYIDYYNNNIKHNPLKLLLVLVLFLIPIITRVSWSLYLNAQTVTSHTQMSELSYSFPSYGSYVVNYFIQKMFYVGTKIGRYVTTPIILFSLSTIILLFSIFMAKNKKIAKNLGVITGSTLIILVIYCIGLVVAYIWLFSSEEATGLASFPRYIGTILLVLMLISIFTVLIYYYNGKLKNISPLIVILLVIACLFPYGRMLYDIKNVFNDQEKLATQEEHKSADEILKDIDPDSKVYLISQGSDGYRYWYNRYYLTPIHIQQLEWALNSPNEPETRWITRKSKEEWQQELDDYDYVFVDKKDDKFIAEYSDLFIDPSSVVDAGLYKVVYVDGILKLQFVKKYYEFDS